MRHRHPSQLMTPYLGFEKLGSAVAIQFLMNILPPTFAVPVGAKIIATRGSVEDSDAYRYVTVFCGIVAVAAALLLIPVRIRMNPAWCVRA
jgi:hypothetical protein